MPAPAVKVYFLGSLRELFGVYRAEVAVEGVEGLDSLLAREFGLARVAAARVLPLRVVKNGREAHLASSVEGGDEVTVFLPLGGG